MRVCVFSLILLLVVLTAVNLTAAMIPYTHPDVIAAQVWGGS